MSHIGRRQRRSCAPWVLCLAILAILSASGFCRSIGDTSAPGGYLSSPSSSSPRKTLDQEIGSPSELAWQAWLLVENKGGGQGTALDSSNILRRITPKSIFIAPELASCPTGFSSDGKSGCKREPIDFNEDAQKIFLLKRLNALYGKGGSNRKKPEPNGPLQINIPISLPAKGSPPEGQQPLQSEQQTPSQSSQAPSSPQEVPQSPAHNKDLSGSVDRLAIPVVISQHVPLNDNNKSQDTVAVVIYNVANDTKKEQKSSDEGEKTSFFLGTANSSGAKKDRPQNSHVVPVAEIVDEMNETFSGVVDYKIPLSLKTVFNATGLSEKKGSSDSSEDMSPTMVLLLSPTKIPLTTTTQPVSESSKMIGFSQSSQNRETEEIDSTTVQTTEQETKSDMDTTIQTVAPLGSQKPVEPVASTIKSTDRFPEKSYIQDETMYADEESQTEAESEDHEDYEETTDETDQDDFSDSEDEILKPGEAGMTIPSKNRDLVKTKHQKHHLSTVSDLEDPTSTTITEVTTMPAFTTINFQDAFDANDSTAKTDATDSTKETIMTTETSEFPSTVMTTEPSTEETTLYTTKMVRSESWMKSTTRRSPTTMPVTTIIGDREKAETQGFFETERDLVTEPEVIFSTQGNHGLTTTFGRKKPPHPAKVVDVPYTIADFEDIVTRTEPPAVLDYHHRDHIDQFRQRPSLTVNNEPIIFKNDDSLPSEFRDQLADSSRPSNSDYRGISVGHINDESSTYVRFPEHLSDVHTQPGGYVRFPSDEVNSIHNQDNFKEHLLSAYRTREDYAGNVSPTSTKSSVPARQKSGSSHWRIPPPGARTDRQQQQLHQQLQAASSGQRQQKQKPMLLRFWARMPLVRDLSFYPTTSHGSHNEPIGGSEGQQRHGGGRAPSAPQARRAGHYKEMSSHEVNRLLAQQLGQPAIGG